MAAILLADHDVSLVPKVMRSTALAGPGLGNYIASSYNGGPSRPIKILKAGKDIVEANSNPENKLYGMKMKAAAALYP
jgi:soluble lytic murein transglycosylase-like protein